MNYADEYFDSLAHGFPEAFGLPMEEARQRLVDALAQLEADGEIRDELVLRQSIWRS